MVVCDRQRLRICMSFCLLSLGQGSHMDPGPCGTSARVPTSITYIATHYMRAMYSLRIYIVCIRFHSWKSEETKTNKQRGSVCVCGETERMDATKKSLYTHTSGAPEAFTCSRHWLSGTWEDEPNKSRSVGFINLYNLLAPYWIKDIEKVVI